MQKIQIHWSKPILLDNRWNSQNFDEEVGVYLISRKYRRNGFCYEKFVYVGETVNFFDKRFKQHINKRSSWLNPIGAKYIRFGKIINIPKKVDDVKHLTLTIESTIIQYIKEKPSVQLVNKKQVDNYTIYYELEIENTGCRGVIPFFMTTLEI